MAHSIQDLREQRKAKSQEMHDLVKSDDGWTDESQTKFDGLEGDVTRLDGQITAIETADRISAENKTKVNTKADQIGVSNDEATHVLNMEKGVFEAYLRGGANALTGEQRQYVDERVSKINNTMSTTTPSEGGYLAPDDFGNQLLEEMKAFGGMRSVATIMPTGDGNQINYPTTDATSEIGEILAQNAETSDEDAGFGTVPIGAHQYSSKAVAVPFALLQDNRIDLEGHLRSRLSTRLGRITNKHYTVGTGTDQPKGAVTASGLGVTGVSATGIVYDELIDLEHSIDPAYRQSGMVSWMFHDNTLKALKKLKDGDSRPIWLPGLEAGAPNEILSHPYTINQDVAEMATGAKSMLFGDFSKYVIRDVMDIMLFRMTDSYYTRKGQVGFLAMIRSDGNLIDFSSSGIKHFKNA